MVNYAFISLLTVKLFEWGVKSFSQSTDMMQTSYVYDPTNTKTETKGEV